MTTDCGPGGAEVGDYLVAKLQESLSKSKSKVRKWREIKGIMVPSGTWKLMKGQKQEGPEGIC